MYRKIDTKRRSIIKMAVAGGAAIISGPFVLSSARAAKADHEMIFADTFSDETEQYVATGIHKFKELAEKYSEGKLVVNLYRGGQLGDQTQLPQKVQYGAVQGCQVSIQNFVPYSNAYNVLDFPFLFPSNEVFENFLGSKDLTNSALVTQPASKGFKVLVGMWANTGFRVFCTSKRKPKEIRIPQDLKGLKVRVTNSKVEQESFKLTPASPVSIAWAETYLALQQGTVDGLNVGLGPLTANRLQEVVATATRLDMSFNAHISVMSQKWFDSLPSSVQEAITRAAEESWIHRQKRQEELNEKMWDEWKSLGITIIDLSPEERSEWIKEIGHQRPEWDPLKKRFGLDLYNQITDYVG